MSPLHHTLVCALIAASSLGSSCDPVHGDAIAALGGEAPGVRTGPLHRGGQPCLLCHDGAIGNPSKFSVAGTVYEKRAPDAATPASGVSVTMTSVNDSNTFTATTNEAGNFFIRSTEWAPTYPMTVRMSQGGTMTCMTTHIGREGSCGGCHVEPEGRGSPGRITLEVLNKIGKCLP